MDTDLDSTRVVTGDKPSGSLTFDGAAPTAAPLPKGTQIDRYVVLERVGQGGMGEVYAAYDPELDRRIALKILSNVGVDSGDKFEGEARRVREAQAMAKLSHPGVVQVYDAGTAGGHLFIAMEFIDGGTLRQWVAQQARSLLDRVRVLALAGEGLAAAHAEGLVHRDFKPHNIMVRDDGVVRVLDFGLARRIGARAGEADSAGFGTKVDREVEGAAAHDSLSQPLTRTGLVHGTPAYMAPEQFADGTVDARSDQFAFCVVAYECFYGERPYATTSFAGLPTAVARAELREAPRGVSIPPRLRAALLTGLDPDPNLRHPDMGALLRAMHHAVVPRWRSPWILGTGGLVVVTLGVMAATGDSRNAAPASPCAAVDSKLTEVWNGERRAAIAAAFEALNLPYTHASLKRVEATVDEYAQQWVAMRAEACRATHERAEQSEDLLDRRMVCLDRHLAELSTLIELLANADAAVAEQAAAAVAALSPVQECLAEALLRSKTGPPEDPALRAGVEALDEERVRTLMTFKAGHHAAARERLQAVYDDARALGHTPLFAQIALDMGTAASSIGDPAAARPYLTEALVAATECDDDVVLLRARIELTGVTGAFLADPERGREHARMAAALATRVDAGRASAGTLDLLVGLMELQEGNAELALTHFERSVDARSAEFGDGSAEATPSVFNAVVQS